MRLRPVILVTAALTLAGCGGEQTVSPRPQTVVGSVPTQSAPTTTSTTSSGGGGGGGTQTTTGGGGGGGGGAASGKALFASNGCVSCHTYKPAGSKASVGPDLDKLATYAKTAKKPLPAFVHESIVNPNAYVQPGFQPNVMPSFASLSKSQVDALVSFLTKGS
ncbi:MAG TPA: cytochrome c [Gaiellaceae bacterium]|jgi:cytochrome c551/c552|nr:cytochrome c [Gaiellaceae bacterium]